MVYVGRLGRNNCAVAFTCDVKDTIWYEVKGEDWYPLPELRVDRVAIQKDIIDKQLAEDELSE